MLSIALNLGGRIGSAFVNTLAEKARSYTLQQLGQRSDLHDEVHRLRGSLTEATAVLRLAERKQQRNKDDEEVLRELLLQLKDAAYDAEDLFGDLDYEDLRWKVAKANEASHDIPSSSISFAANSSNSGDHDFAAKARRVRERLDAASNDTQKIIAVLKLEDSGRQDEMPARKPKSSSLPAEPRMIGRDKEKVAKANEASHDILRRKVAKANKASHEVLRRKVARANEASHEVLRRKIPKANEASHDILRRKVARANEASHEVLRRKVPKANEASHDIPSSSFSVAVNSSNSGDDDFAAKARGVRERLDAASKATRKIINSLNLDEIGRQHGMPPQKRESSSLPTEPRMIGRDKEKEHLIRLLLNTADVSGSSTADRNVSVLPVVGMGGLGKTTLAQFVYQDTQVRNHFQLKMWVCVSNEPFDVKRLTRMILECAAEKELSNLSSLQEHLKEKVSSKRYLLVLDDVWNEDRKEWEKLFAPLRYGLQGSMIMVTTRSEMVVQAMAGTLDPIFLKGLPEDDYKEFFKTCAFRSENPKDRPEMEEIAERIAAKLKGSPLAAKTLGGSLNSNMDVRHWRNIMNSEIWQVQQKEKDIMPVLELSYQHLPLHLKPCFSICSIYPQDYNFEATELVYLWMAQGFLVPPRPNMLLEDVGNGYLLDLTSRSFFQKGRWDGNHFQIHDLMHDLAKYVSKDDCFSIPNDGPKIPSSIRHLSIKCTENHELLDEVMKSEYNFNKLRSLVIFRYLSSELNSAIVRWLDGLQYIRVLYLISQYPIAEFPDSIGNLKHLQFLKISAMGFSTLPESFCRLYNLKFLNIRWCGVRNFPRGFANLINLRRIDTENLDISKVTGIGKLTNLQYLKYFGVQKEHGHGIDELKNLKQLHGSLCIAHLENVESREDACQANLDNKEYIDELTLQWARDRNTCIAGSIDFSGNTEVLEGLKPHRNLKKLSIDGYGGDKLPSWLQTQTLSCLYELSFEHCPNITDVPCISLFLKKLKFVNSGLKSLPLLEGEGSVDQGIYARGSNSTRSSALSELYLEWCQNLTSLEEWLLPERLPSIKIIHIVNCRELVSLPVERFKNFISLEVLYIEHCPKLTGSKKLELNPSIKVLKLKSCGELELSTTPSYPQNRSSLIRLEISDSLHLKCLPGQLLHHMPALKNLTITFCPELRSIGGLDALTSLEYLTILECPKLTDLESLPSEREVQRKDQIISHWTINKTALLKQPFAQILRSFHLHLSIFGSGESVWFDEGDDQEWLQILTSLRSLTMFDCHNLRSLPTWLHRLTSLRALEIYACAMESLPENGLPTSLTKINFSNVRPMLRKQLEEAQSKIAGRPLHLLAE